MSLQSLFSKIHKTLLLRRMEEWENKEQTFCSDKRFGTDSPYRRGAARALPAPTLTFSSAGVKHLLSMELNWVSFEVDLFLIREILPFMCLSPGCQALCTWTVRSLESLDSLPVGGMDIFPEIWIDLVHTQPSAFCLAFSLTTFTSGLGKLSSRRCPWAASESGKNFPILQILCFIIEGR